MARAARVAVAKTVARAVSAVAGRSVEPATTTEVVVSKTMDRMAVVAAMADSEVVAVQEAVVVVGPR